MYKELNRLATFSDWDGTATVSPLQLARNGFFYSRSSGEIVCFSCDFRFNRWSDKDNPCEHHQQFSSNCPLVVGTETRNTPLNPSNSPWKPPQVAPDRHINTSSDPIENVLRSALNRARANRFFSGNSTYRIDHSCPDFVQLRHETVRLGTFDDWPSTAHASPWALAREGFFYTGIEDRVQCVFCRGCLRRWQPKDSPSQEHSKHYPACAFVRGLDVGNVPAERATIALPADDQSLLTRSEGSTLQTGEQSQMLRQVEAFRILDQGNEMIDLEARMNVPAVRAVLEMGFSREVVKRTIENKLSTTGADFPNAESLLDAVFLAGETSNYHNDEPASATAATPSSSSSLSFAATSVPPQAVVVNDTKASKAATGLTSLLSTHSSRDSGIFSASFSASSLPSVYPGFQHLCGNSSSPSSSLASTSVQPETDPLAPAKPDPCSAPATKTLATIPEAATSSQTKLKAKRKRNRKKMPAPTASSDKDLKEDLMPNEKNDEEMTGNEAGKEEDKEAGSKMDTNPDDEAQKFLEENRQLREERTCKVCMDAEVNTVFLPCGHLVCCNTCSPLLRNCPICRTFIRGTVKTSLS